MRTNDVAVWDELEILKREAVRLWVKGKPDRKRIEEFCDWLEFVLCHVYAWGWQGVEDIIGKINVMFNGDLDTVNITIDGKTFRDRMLDAKTAEEVIRIIETEAHRDLNAGTYNAAKASGIPGLRKRWNTMLDDRVRDQHSYLEGVEVGLDDLFYTYSGDSALYPGGFGVPELDINCRCTVSIVI